MEQLELITVTKGGGYELILPVISPSLNTFIYSSVECTPTLYSLTFVIRNNPPDIKGVKRERDASDSYHHLQLSHVVRREVRPLQMEPPSPNRNQCTNHEPSKW